MHATQREDEPVVSAGRQRELLPAMVALIDPYITSIPSSALISVLSMNLTLLLQIPQALLRKRLDPCLTRLLRRLSHRFPNFQRLGQVECVSAHGQNHA